MSAPKFIRYEGGFNFNTSLKTAKAHKAYWQEDMLLTVANRLSAEMECQNVTQAELARRLEVSPAYVSRILKGHENLTLNTLAKIAFELGKRWECVMTNKDERITIYATFANEDATSIRRTESATISFPPSDRATHDDSAYTSEALHVVQVQH